MNTNMKKIFLVVALSIVQCSAMQKSDLIGASYQPIDSSSAGKDFINHVARGEVTDAEVYLKKEIITKTNLNSLTHNGQTALLIAINRGNALMVTLLLNYGANPELQGRREDPLLLACQRGYNSIIIALLKAGARIYIVEFSQELFNSNIDIFNVTSEVVEMLINAGATPWINSALFIIRHFKTYYEKYGQKNIENGKKNVRLLIAAGAYIPFGDSGYLSVVYEDFPLLEALLLHNQNNFEKTLATYQGKAYNWKEINEAMMVAYAQKKLVRGQAIYALLKTFPEHHQDLIRSLRLVLQSAVVDGNLELLGKILEKPELQEGSGKAIYYGHLLELALMRHHRAIMERLLKEQPSLDSVERFLKRPSAAKNSLVQHILSVNEAPCKDFRDASSGFTRFFRNVVGYFTGPSLEPSQKLLAPDILTQNFYPLIIARANHHKPSSRLSLLPRDLIEYLIGPMVIDSRKNFDFNNEHKKQ